MVEEVLQDLGDEVHGSEDLAIGAKGGVVGRLVQQNGRTVFHEAFADKEPDAR